MHGYAEGSPVCVRRTGRRFARSTHTQRVSPRLTFKAFWLLLLLGGLLAGFAAIPAWAAEELFVTNYEGHSITVYNRTDSGDHLPLRTLAGAATGLSSPFGLVLDLTHNELFVANAGGVIAGGNSITVYNRTDSDNSPPLRTLAGPATGLDTPFDLVLDLTHNELFVASLNIDSITVYNRTDSDNSPPLRTLAGPATGLNGPKGLLLDLTHNELFVANADGHSITVYNRTDSGDHLPLRTLAGPATGLNGPRGLLLDNDELFVTNGDGNSITVYNRTDSGDHLPLRTLAGPATGLNGPRGLILDNNELFVANFVGNSITVYNRTDSDNSPPLRTLAGAATGLNGPKDPALSDSSTGIPTLSEWAQIGMAVLLLGGGLLALRRNRQLS